MRRRVTVLTIFAALFAIGIWGVVILKNDYDFSQFWPKNSKETNFYLDYLERFGGDDDYIAVAIESENDGFTLDEVHRINVLGERLDSLDLVQRVINPFSMKYSIRTPLIGTFVDVPFFHVDSLYSVDTAKWMGSELPISRFFSEDHKSAYILIKHNDRLPTIEAKGLVNSIEELAKSSFNKTHITGRVVAQKFYVEKTRSDLVKFVGASVALIIIFLVIAFRSFFGVIVPAICVALTVVTSLGIMALSGQSMNLILNISPSILMIISLSGVIHFYSKYLDKLRAGMNKQEAVADAMKHLRKAIIYTNVTTVIGFFSLLTTNISPLMIFGFWTGIGVLISMMVTLFLLPQLVLMTPTPEPKQLDLGKFWSRLFLGISIFNIKNKKLVLLVTAVVIGLSVYFGSKVHPNNFVIEDLPAGHYLKDDYAWFDHNFGFSRPMDFELELGDSTELWDVETLKSIDHFEDSIQKYYHTTGISSVLIPIKLTNMAFHSGNPDYFKVPSKKSRLRKIKKHILSNRVLYGLKAFVDSTDRKLSIRVSMRDVGSIQSGKWRDSLLTTEKDTLLTSGISVTPTGGPYLMELNTAVLAENVVYGLLLAISLITILIALLFRSVKAALISLIPNLLPIVMIAGTMGLMGLDLKMSTSLVFTIVFGIAVDDTIHFMTAYKGFINRGVANPLKATMLTTGKAMTLTTVVVSGGFLTLVLSDFKGTFLVGVLVCLALLYALLSDIFVLPVLLKIFNRNGK